MAIDLNVLAKALVQLGTLDKAPKDPAWEDLLPAYNAVDHSTHNLSNDAPFYAGEMPPVIQEAYTTVLDGGKCDPISADEKPKKAPAKKAAPKKAAKKPAAKKKAPSKAKKASDKAAAKAETKLKPQKAKKAATEQKAAEADAEKKEEQEAAKEAKKDDDTILIVDETVEERLGDDWEAKNLKGGKVEDAADEEASDDTDKE